MDVFGTVIKYCNMSLGDVCLFNKLLNVPYFALQVKWGAQWPMLNTKNLALYKYLSIFILIYKQKHNKIGCFVCEPQNRDKIKYFCCLSSGRVPFSKCNSTTMVLSSLCRNDPSNLAWSFRQRTHVEVNQAIRLGRLDKEK